MKKNVKSREILQVPAHYRDILVQIMNESYSWTLGTGQVLGLGKECGGDAKPRCPEHEYMAPC